MRSDLTTAYLRWSLLRAALARGWWLATALYLVLVAGLSPSQLVLIGVFQGLTVVVAEVPAGVLADAVSRRLALVVAHVVMGTGMAMTGFVTAFPLLVVSQCLWGLGWAIASGADVAWITDELDRFDLIDGVLTAQGRFDLIGAVAGIIVFGTLGWATTLSVAIVVAGVSMIGLGLAIVARWPESRCQTDLVGRPWAASAAVLRRGVAVARTDRVIVLVLASTLLVNGGAEGFGRLFERRLLALGMPTTPDPIVWFAALALVAAALGATTLLFVEARIAGVGVATRTYVAGCGIGTVGLVVFALAPSTASAVAGALLVRGIAFPTVRVAGTILVNRRTPSNARATVHSMLSQSENAGEIICGLALAAIASATSSTVTLMASAALVAAAGATLAAGDRESAG
jgi:MFS family permease